MTEDVLPSIRKTGGYAMPNAGCIAGSNQDRVTSIPLIGEGGCQGAGVKTGIAMAAAPDLHSREHRTGDRCASRIADMQRATGGGQSDQTRRARRTLGQDRSIVVSPISAISFATNATSGNDGGRRTWGEALPFSRNGHSGYQILWKLDVADRLKEVA